MGPDHTVVEMEDADGPGDTRSKELSVNRNNDNNRNNVTNDNIEDDSMRDDDQGDNENEKEKESNEEPPELGLEEQSFLMKITRKLVDSLSLTCPGRLTPGFGGSNLLYFRSMQLYFGEELDL